MTQMTFGISVQVPNGPQMALTGTQAAEAYDKIELTVDPGGGAAPEVNIQIQPGPAVGGNDPRLLLCGGDRARGSARLRAHRPRRDAVTALLCPIVPSACHKETVPCQPH